MNNLVCNIIINMESYGIKIKGHVYQIDKMTIDDEQSQYNYVCTLLGGPDPYGNGGYEVKFYDSEDQGLHNNGWTITKAHIGYSWNNSMVRIALRDSLGHLTDDRNYPVAVSMRGGSDKGLPDNWIVKQLYVLLDLFFEFTKNYETVEEWQIKRDFEKNCGNHLYSCGIDDFIDTYLPKINKAVESYKALKSFLENQEDEKYETELTAIEDKFKAYFSGLKIK